jgi:hypothetical protein
VAVEVLAGSVVAGGDLDVVECGRNERVAQHLRAHHICGRITGIRIPTEVARCLSRRAAARPIRRATVATLGVTGPD